MLPRSLHPPKLMNGTRCLMVSCGRNVVGVKSQLVLTQENDTLSHSSLSVPKKTVPSPTLLCHDDKQNSGLIPQNSWFTSPSTNLHLLMHGMLYDALSRDQK
ncbi:hypothetical protein ElyMa_001368200 [Elysia marginata]|uniref:Uncharacterized protein n=1 Tax=Elysia marginata TaxID=1093978 RepID=A0AAV4IU86_9GAST|nr:hypothetical protein ElyMa_001368200 [Elysia marginata]